MTGTIDARNVKVTNIDASEITTGMFTVGTDKNNSGALEDSEIIFQAGYNENKNDEPQVKIGGFTVDTDSIAAGKAGTTTGIKLTSGKTEMDKVIQAGTNFSVDASGKIFSTGGTIGGFEISPSRLFGGVTGTDSNKKDRVIALYAPILPLTENFLSTTSIPTGPTAFKPDSVTLD